MRSPKFFGSVFAAVFVLVLGALGYFFMNPMREHVRQLGLADRVVEPSMVSPQFSSTEQPMAAGKAPSLDSPKQKLVSSELLSRYNSERNMRAFVSHAVQHPEQGGYFYAARVIRQCQGTARDYPPEVTGTYIAGMEVEKFQKMADAAERLRMRCADFLDSELSEQRARDFWKKGRELDPLIKATVDYTDAFSRYLKNPQDTRSRAEALRRLLEVGDPLLFDDLGMRLSLHLQNGRTGYMLGGIFYELDSGTDVGLAHYLLPCAAGLVCDEREFDVATRCGSGGDCDSGRFRRVERMVESLPGAYQKILGAYEGMRAALARRDAGFFLGP